MFYQTIQYQVLLYLILLGIEVHPSPSWSASRQQQLQSRCCERLVNDGKDLSSHPNFWSACLPSHDGPWSPSSHLGTPECQHLECWWPQVHHSSQGQQLSSLNFKEDLFQSWLSKDTNVRVSVRRKTTRDPDNESCHYCSGNFVAHGQALELEGPPHLDIILLIQMHICAVCIDFVDSTIIINETIWPFDLILFIWREEGNWELQEMVNLFYK